MWIAGIFGIATKYVEVYASVRYRVRDYNGQMLGGVMYVWERAFKRADGSGSLVGEARRRRVRGFRVVATIGTGSAVQASAMSGIITSSVPVIPNWAVAIAVVVAVSAVVFGGVRSISRVCEWLVPIMAIAYALGCVVIMGMNFDKLGEAVVLIVECAFTPKGGFRRSRRIGLAHGPSVRLRARFVLQRVGLGHRPHRGGGGQDQKPAEQALIAMTGTFWSTVVICLLHGIVLVSTMLNHPDIQAQILENPSIYTGAMLASAAFAKIPVIGSAILVLGMVSFSYSTILGWSYYGNRCVTYLFGSKAVVPYQIVYVAVAFLGAIGVGDVVWTISDIGNALMAIPNIIAVLLLSGMIARETKHYVYEGQPRRGLRRAVPIVESK